MREGVTENRTLFTHYRQVKKTRTRFSRREKGKKDPAVLP
uniref:Uncharacterized protein n=1 Tax=Klebsiella pneumoniae TaxID=573 RepID=A0A8B0STN8_KLEPN|nr:hypothetical protein [Klebsiella pneumoniae]